MRLLIVMATVFSMTVLPTVPSAFAGPAPVKSKVSLQNVELSTAGTVAGHIVDAKGAPLSNAKMQIRTKAGAQDATTDARGRFSVESKVGGNCAIVVGDKAYACRLWTNGTAPAEVAHQVRYCSHKGTDRSWSVRGVCRRLR